MRAPLVGLVLLCGSLTACMPPAPPMAVTTTSASEFAMNAASSNLLEIESSRLALERSSSPDVRRFARRMIQDHTAASRRMAAVARARGLSVPATLSPRHAAMMQTLMTASDGGFDRAYTTLQANAHQEAVALFSTYADRGDDPALRSFAARTLPTLQMHADMLRSTGTPMAGM